MCYDDYDVHLKIFDRKIEKVKCKEWPQLVADLRPPPNASRNEDDGLKENLEKIDKLLAKVYTVRRDVIDQVK